MAMTRLGPLRQWLAAMTILVLVLVLGACGGSSEDAGETEAAGPSGEASAAPEPTATVASTPVVGDEVNEPETVEAPLVFEDFNPEPPSFAPKPLKAGKYISASLPVALTFDIADDTFRNGTYSKGQVVLSSDAHPSGAWLSVHHPVAVNDYQVPGVPTVAAPFTGVEDLIAGSGLTIVEGKGMLGGQEVQWWDVSFDESTVGDCDPDCLLLWEVSGGTQWAVLGTHRQRLWEQQTDAGPLVMSIEATEEDWDEFVAISDATLATFELGEPIGTPASGDEPRLGLSALEVVDPTRPTDERMQGGVAVVPGSDQRTLEVLLGYPSADGGTNSAPIEGTYPLILVAKGLGDKHQMPHEALQLVNEGYVVALVRFPESSSPGANFNDYTEQPADITAVLDALLGEETPGDEVPGSIQALIDPERVGAMGFSLGGATFLAIGAGPCCIDERVDAIVSHAGAVLSFDGGWDWPSAPPTLVIAGANDTIVPPSNADALIEDLPAPGYVVVLDNETHITWSGSDNAEPVQALLEAFFDAYLRDGDPALVDELGQAMNGTWSRATG